MSSGGDDAEVVEPPLGGAKSGKDAKAKKADSKVSKETPFDGDAKAEKASSSKSGKAKSSKSAHGDHFHGYESGPGMSFSASMSMSASMSVASGEEVSTTSWLPSARYLRN